MRTAILQADDARVTSVAHRALVDRVLKSGSADAQVLAVRALGRTRRAEFLQRAVAALRHPSIDVRREAAFAIGHIGSSAASAHDAARDALGRQLAREQDPLVMASLSESLGRLPYPDAASIQNVVDGLASAWTRAGTGPARAVVSVGVARGAEAMARRGRTLASTAAELPRLVALLESLLDRHGALPPGQVAAQDLLDRRVRRLATGGLVTLRALAPTRRQIAAADSDAQVRRLAVLDLANQAVVTEDDAVSAFSDASMLVRHVAVARLGPRLQPLAERAIGDVHLAVRLAAIDALGEARACRTACEAKLSAAQTNATWHEAAHALVAFARSHVEAARSHVTRAAASEVWQVRMYAARAAGVTTQGDVLALLATDAEPNVRHAALLAWREAGLAGLAPAAVAALASDDGQLVIEAATALKGVAGEPATVTALRTALVRITAQKRATSRDPRMALIERLDELDVGRVTTLRPYLSDFDPVVAERVAALLNARSATAAKVTASPRPLVRARVPTWSQVAELRNTLVTFRFVGGRSVPIRLYADYAPTATARFVAQVKAGDWHGRTFHRVEPGFVVQGGSPAANEYAGAAAFARDEFSALSNLRGAMGISTRGDDTGDGQIFINLVDNPRLDFSFTIIGSAGGNAGVIDDLIEGEIIVEAVAREAQVVP